MFTKKLKVRSEDGKFATEEGTKKELTAGQKFKRFVKFIGICIVLTVAFAGVYQLNTIYQNFKHPVTKYEAPAVDSSDVAAVEKQSWINNYMASEAFKNQALATAELAWNKKHLSDVQADQAKTTQDIIKLQDESFQPAGK